MTARDAHCPSLFTPPDDRREEVASETRAFLEPLRTCLHCV